MSVSFYIFLFRCIYFCFVLYMAISAYKNRFEIIYLKYTLYTNGRKVILSILERHTNFRALNRAKQQLTSGKRRSKLNLGLNF
jgi:hypothetical protein